MTAGRYLATFWSLNSKLAVTDRYHLGQLSVAQYVDEAVAGGASHYAIVCDNEGLGLMEYSRIHEVGSAINCLCNESLIVRTLTFYRSAMNQKNLALRNQTASEIRQIRERLQGDYSEVGDVPQRWRSGTIRDDQFLDMLTPGNVIPQLEALPVSDRCGIVYLMLCPPVWYDDYWFATMFFSLRQLSDQCSSALEIVEAERNRYVWLALRAASQLVRVPKSWALGELRFDFRPNVKSDGPRGYMCADEMGFALRVHASPAEVQAFVEASSTAVMESISTLILGRGPVPDRRTLSLELSSVLARVQQRWFFGTSAESVSLDPVLKISNRAQFDRDLTEFPIAASRDLPLTLVLVDLDHFKSVNDKYGHVVGDNVLAHTAALIKKTCGTKGHCYRYGGDEIAVFFPNHSCDEGKAAAQRIRREISESNYEGCPDTVTVSIGVATYPQTTTNSADLVKAVDKALYAAKDLGRNRVCCANP